ncbi:MAG TPA: fumarylacetoacetate hydrolase family protein [Actinomycetota bacterium]|nr:fumarylacetoacetate hydrolase family protein [Actinomycetota bacterium]
MRLVRFRSGSRIATGSLSDGFVRPLRGTFFEDPVPTGEEIPAADVRLLAPVIPSKVVCVGKNYLEHAEEMGGQVPEEPIIFVKPSTAVVGPGDPIARPTWAGRVDHEGELGIVIGRLARDVKTEQAGQVILGYTCGNDVTARELQAKDGQWTRAKGFDTFCPLGPWVETELDAGDVAVECRVNGEVRQSARTSQLAFGPGELIEFVTSVMTLLPGDVILTGTPAGVGPLVPGDRVEVEVEGIGVLENEVVDRA